MEQVLLYDTTLRDGLQREGMSLSVDEQIAGDQAYVVAPCSYTYKQGGKTVRESGFIAFILVKTGATWKVASWTWASPAGAEVN